MVATKAWPARVKAGPQDGLADGQFEAIVSVFGNIDAYGEVVAKGAFADTLAEWKATGDPIPVIWSHRYTDPDYHVGVVLDAEERDTGLWVRGQLDLDAEASKARQVYRLLKGRRVKEFSFSYDELDAGPAKVDGQDVWELRRLKVYEVGPTLIGANPDTQLLGVKTAADQLVRAVTATPETRLGARASLLTAAEHISGALSALDTSTDDGKATASAPAADETPQVKSTSPMHGPRSVRLLLDLAEREFDLSD